MHIQPPILVAALAAAALANPMPAAAGREIVNATGICSGATPAAEGVLRKRPLGITNEGTGTVFVNCSLPTDGEANPGYTHVIVTLVHRSGSGALPVYCTLVDGAAAELASTYPDLPLPHYYPLLVEVPPHGSTAIEWNAAAQSIERFSALANLSCALPAGMEMNYIAGTYPAPDR